MTTGHRPTFRGMGAGKRLDALVVAVVLMRRHQRAYFRTRTPHMLIMARDAERSVDQILDDIMPGQSELFDSGERRQPPDRSPRREGH